MCLFLGVMYCATKNYKATKKDEASLDMGSVVEVMLKSDDGWWLIRYVPEHYRVHAINTPARRYGYHVN